MGITSEKLYEIIRNELVPGVESTDIVDVVLPMLEQAWEEGYNAGKDDHFLTRNDTPNPYRTKQ